MDQLGLFDPGPVEIPDQGKRNPETAPAGNPEILRCPRCAGELVGARFYGPCSTCRDELRADAAQVEPERPVADRPAKVTGRVWRRVAPRFAGWLDWPTGAGVLDNGAPFTVPARATVAQLLAALPAEVERVQLVGPRPFAGDPDRWRQWTMAPAPGWSGGDHFLERPDRPVLRWVADGGRRVELQRAATWFGDEGDEASPEQAREGWAILARHVAARFDGAAVLATPATTGRELFARTIPDGAGWPVLSDELAELIRSTSGQGRIELRDVGDELPGLHVYDGRFMYGALCHELPAGVAVRGKGEPEGGRFARARVLARWTVPADWAHVGILPAQHPGGGWHYPAEPGQTAGGWVDAVELDVARRFGWSVEVVEHVAWPERSRPLDAWARRLAELRAAIAGEVERGEVEPGAGELARVAARHVLIDALGAFVGRAHTITRSVPLEQMPAELPAGAQLPHVEGGLVTWAEPRPPAWPEMVHPEWPATVWARCRARLLDGPTGAKGVRSGALHVPAGDVLAFRTDAVYLTRRAHWPDDGRLGRLRWKGGADEPMPAPATVADLLAQRDGLGAVL